MAPAIRWGIIGAGTVSRHFALSLRLLPGASLQAVGSRRSKRAATFAAEIGAPRHYSDYGALVADPKVDAVYIATPSALHHEHALLAISAGKAVLCEKPFATSAAHARQVVEAARGAGVFCMEAMWMRFIPIVRELRKIVREGIIGDVRLLQADLGFPIPYEAGSRYYDPKLGGGALLDLGVYPLSLSFFLLGAPTAEVALQSSAPNGVDEQLCVVLSHGQALASLTCSFANKARNNAFILGSRGSIELHAPLYAPTRMTLIRSAASTAGPSTGESGEAGPIGRLVDRVPKLVELRRRLSPNLKALLRGRLDRRSRPFPGFGYQFEAEEVARCLQAGELESPLMPLGETVAIAETIDHLHKIAHQPETITAVDSGSTE